MTALERALQGRPAERLAQDGTGVEQQVAAVGPVQGARLDQPEVGRQGALASDVLDAADQVCERRMQFLYDGRPLFFALRDQQVHLVAVEGGNHHRAALMVRPVALLRHEKADILYQIGPHALQMVEHSRKLNERPLDLLDQVADGVLRGFLPELAKLCAALLVPSRNGLQNRLQILLQDLNHLVHAVALVLRQRVEDVGP